MVAAAGLRAALLLTLAAAQGCAAPQLPGRDRPALLIVSKTGAYRHDSIAEAVPAIERLAAARGWSGVATEDSAVFDRERLARFDLVVFASSTGDIFTPEQAAAFRKWVARGNGVVALHAAGDGSHPEWFARLLGSGKYVGHPGGADQFQAGELIVEDRAHPATRHLPARWRWTEEFYSWDAPPAADARVLARLDESGVRLEPRLQMGAGHALVWWRCEGRARVFYSALGHRAEAWSDPANLALIDGAMAWAARREGEGCD